MIKIGTTWKINTYRVYKNKNGVLKSYDGGLLQYKITDIKKPDSKNYLLVAINVSYTSPKTGLSGEENISAIYNIKCRTFKTIEPEINQEGFSVGLGFTDLTILKNGKLNVKYLDENAEVYVVDLPKVA